MRVMHVMAGAQEGGAENIMLESVCALAGAGLDQFVITRPDNQFRLDMFAEAGIGYATCSFNLRWPFPTRQKIKQAIERFRPDVIEYWMGRAGQFAPAKYKARSIGWYGGYYKLARFTNCDWHIGLTKDLLRHIREQGVADDRSMIVLTGQALIPPLMRPWLWRWHVCTRKKGLIHCSMRPSRSRGFMSGLLAMGHWKAP